MRKRLRILLVSEVCSMAVNFNKAIGGYNEV